MIPKRDLEATQEIFTEVFDLDLSGYFIFSLAEYLALFYMAYKLFRFKFHIKEIVRLILLGVFLTIVDYLFKFVFDWGEYSVTVQLICIVLFFRTMKKICLFYAVVVGSVGYAAYILIQISFALLLAAVNMYGMSAGHEITNLETIRLQVISICTAVTIGFLFSKNRWGFTLISENTYRRFDLKKIDNYFISVLFFSWLTIASVSYSFWRLDQLTFILLFFVLLILFWISLYMLNRQEVQDN